MNKYILILMLIKTNCPDKQLLMIIFSDNEDAEHINCSLHVWVRLYRLYTGSLHDTRFPKEPLKGPSNKCRQWGMNSYSPHKGIIPLKIVILQKNLQMVFQRFL